MPKLAAILTMPNSPPMDLKSLLFLKMDPLFFGALMQLKAFVKMKIAASLNFSSLRLKLSLLKLAKIL